MKVQAYLLPLSLFLRLAPLCASWRFPWSFSDNNKESIDIPPLELSQLLIRLSKKRHGPQCAYVQERD